MLAASAVCFIKTCVQTTTSGLYPHLMLQSIQPHLSPSLSSGSLSVLPVSLLDTYVSPGGVPYARTNAKTEVRASCKFSVTQWHHATADASSSHFNTVWPGCKHFLFPGYSGPGLLGLTWTILKPTYEVGGQSVLIPLSSQRLIFNLLWERGVGKNGVVNESCVPI